MTNAMQQSPGSIIENVITKGDLAKLSAEERTRYYVAVCDSIGVNPMTQPFAYITLNNKLTLYALRNCTDQLRLNRGVSVEDMSESEREGVYVVTCKVKDKDGRTDAAKGAVSVAGLRGEALANAIMKCETKAKRRATLSICGLGMLDEAEVDTIPNATRLRVANPPPPHNPETGEIWERTAPHLIPLPEAANGVPNWIAWGSMFVRELQHAEDHHELEAWIVANGSQLDACEIDKPQVYERLQTQMRVARERMQPELIEAPAA